VNVGDKLNIFWPDGDSQSCQKLVGKVIDIVNSKKEKKDSNIKYKIYFKAINETRIVKLSKVKWELRRKRSHESNAPTVSPTATENGSKRQKTSTLSAESYKRILAPMVGASELAFRLLCRRYGATLAYTPMMSSDRFAVDPLYREQEFQTVPEDRPLVAHFSANDPDVFLAAAKHVEHTCDAIDLNLGCPQRVAHSGHFGSFLLDPEDRPLVLKMVNTLSTNLSIPLFVKIRLLNSVDETTELCQQLITAGAALIAIHGRYRVNLVGRTGPGARDGAAHLDEVKEVIQRLREQGFKVPIIANGNVRTWEDVVENAQFTDASGIMSAEGLLDNPALFHQGIDSSAKIRNKPEKGEVDKLVLAQEYLDLVEKHPTKLKTVIFHIRRMCKDELTEYQLMEECLNAPSPAALQEIVTQMVQMKQSGTFQQDPNKAKRAKDALERKKREEGKRRDFEDRMKRKAKREGRPLDFYLSQGAAPPTKEIIERLKKLPSEEAFQEWKIHYSQHCFAFHFGTKKSDGSGIGGCERDRTCSFLHAEFVVTSAEEPEVYG